MFFERKFDGNEDLYKYTLLGKAVCAYGYVTATKAEGESWTFSLNGVNQLSGELQTSCVIDAINKGQCYWPKNERDTAIRCVPLGLEGDGKCDFWDSIGTSNANGSNSGPHE
jgi:hypothetical protein